MSAESKPNESESLEQRLNRFIGVGIIAVEELISVASYFKRDPRGSVVATIRYGQHLFATAKNAVVDEIDMGDLDLLRELNDKPTKRWT